MTQSFQEARARSKSRCGVGLGLRWDFLDEVLEQERLDVAFWEISPENYMKRGGYFPEALERLREDYLFVTHGLTMGAGAIDPPSSDYLSAILAEIERVQSPFHSDHLCISSAGPLVLHDLLPLALTKKNAQRVADRIRYIEDKTDRPFLVENVSFYAHPAPPELSEEDFLCEVLRKSDAGLLLDVNNVYVNSVNHGYDPGAFLKALPHEQIVQLHIAGHSALPSSHPAYPLLLDTHGAPVIDPVKELFEKTLACVGPIPVVLERDNEIPPLPTLLEEVRELQQIYDRTLPKGTVEEGAPCR